MNKIEEIIKRTCPNDIKYKPLWTLVNFNKKFKGVEKSKQEKIIKSNNVSAEKLKSLIVKNGNIKLLSVGKFDGFTNQELANGLIDEGEVITIPSGGTADIKYYKGKFVNSGNILLFPKNKDVNLKFIYHYLLKENNFIQSSFRGGSVQHPDMNKVINMLIPIPTLEAQCEIVHILDNFTELTAYLTAELFLEKKQYKFYLDKFFTKNNNIYIKDVINSLHTGLNPRKNFKLNMPGANKAYITGKEIFNNQINISDKTDYITKEDVNMINKRSKLEDNVLLFASTGCSTVGRMALVDKYDGTWNVSETMYCIKTKSIVLTKYLMYFLYSNNALNQYEGKISKGTVPHLKVSDLLKIKMPLITIEKQNNIINILEKLDKYCNDLKEGLPAEIKYRQQQYEYYRDKLLTFKKVGE